MANPSLDRETDTTAQERGWIPGRGFDKLLRSIMLSQILPLMEEFDNKRNPDHVYEERLQAAADYFIAEASKLPRATGCYPPCGFQISGNVYNCVTCLYDSCEYPLDCAMRDSTVGEYNSTEIRCDVHFPLPSSIEIVWRFAPQVRTQQVEQFGLVTVGDDQHFSIPSAQSRHQGTYQCEVFSYQRSIVRTYHHLTVIPQDTVAQSRLQGVFDMALFPGGRFPDQPGGLPPDQAPPTATGPQLVPAPSLLTACLFALSLLLFLSLG
ncbi:hypothetical protein AGOR_G00212880 [Albula goreensis]|uniref:Ig-like domain-containing protein n=1 Tax=Albula goreensis TaxID=1534307 RepID=A0A8T3CMG5_9TELE|nr:hypothetical protein AGOR_G00212880 [Albula goreensis]